jgi:hypothetical protein
MTETMTETMTERTTDTMTKQIEDVLDNNKITEDQNDNAEKTTDQKSFVCDKCNKDCETPKELKIHKKTYCRLRDKGTPNKPSSDLKHVKCFKCGKFGHSVKSCNKNH